VILLKQEPVTQSSQAAVPQTGSDGNDEEAEDEDYDAARRRQMEQVKAARAAALAVAAQYDAATAVRILFYFLRRLFLHL
jgi:hypothetical protein